MPLPFTPLPHLPFATCGLIRIDFDFYLDIFRVAQVIIIVRSFVVASKLNKR